MIWESIPHNQYLGPFGLVEPEVAPGGPCCDIFVKDSAGQGRPSQRIATAAAKQSPLGACP